MVTLILRASRVTATLLLPPLVSGCCSLFSDDGCKSDKDCKGDRICVAGECAEPGLATPPSPQNPNAQPPHSLVPEPQARPQPAQPQPQPNPQPVSKPAPQPAQPAQPACTDYYCTTRKGTIGMCKSGVCTDPCGPGTGFDPTDTQCHKMCKSSSQCVAPDKCSGGICVPW